MIKRAILSVSDKTGIVELARRLADKGVTLRELAAIAHVSPGYLSELERGRKEVSSEMLAAVCHGLDTTVAEVLIEAAGNMVLPSVEEELANTAPAASEA